MIEIHKLKHIRKNGKGSFVWLSKTGGTRAITSFMNVNRVDDLDDVLEEGSCYALSFTPTPKIHFCLGSVAKPITLKRLLALRSGLMMIHVLSDGRIDNRLVQAPFKPAGVDSFEAFVGGTTPTVFSMLNIMKVHEVTQ